MSIEIRLATSADAPEIHRTMIAAFEPSRGKLVPPSGAHDESVEDVRAALERGGALLALHDGTAVGSVRFEVHPDHLHVGRLSVIPAVQGQGIGAALLRAVEDFAIQQSIPEITLFVRLVLDDNLRFYDRLGYRSERVEDHPSGLSKVVLMAKTLSLPEMPDRPAQGSDPH